MGISGVGKTTLGQKLKDRLEAEGHRTYLIDGDLVRDFFDRDLGYSREERIQNIKRILLSAYVLSQNGVTPIVCNIFPIEALRVFARKKIPDFYQIYLKRDLEGCVTNDVKGLYAKKEKAGPIVGIDVEFEPPTQNDLEIQTGQESPDESFKKLYAFAKSKLTQVKK